MPDPQQYDLSTAARDPGFLAASMGDKTAFLSAHDADFAKASPQDQAGYINHLLGNDQQAAPAPRTLTSTDFDADTDNTSTPMRFLKAAGGSLINTPKAMWDTVMHPIDTAKNVGQSVAAWANPETRPTWEGIKSVLPEALGSGVGGVAGGELAGAAAGVAGDVASVPGGKVSNFLRSSAQKNYEGVLNPTKVSTKYQTQEMMPQLLQERPIAMTRQGLAKKAGAQAEQAGQQIEQHVSGMQGSMTTQPVIDALQNLKQANQVNGVSLRPEVDSAVDSVSDQMQQIGPNISLQDAVKARRILDNAVSEAKGYQGAQLSDASMAAIRKEAANSLRSELGQANPDLAALNAKFHFWNSLSDVMDATIQRKTGQVDAFPKVQAAVVGAGGLAKAGLSGGATAAMAMYLLGKTVRSTGWRTVMASLKGNIADALAGGDFDRAVGLIRKTGLAGQIATGGQNPQDDDTAPEEKPFSNDFLNDPEELQRVAKQVRPGKL